MEYRLLCNQNSFSYIISVQANRYFNESCNAFPIRKKCEYDVDANWKHWETRRDVKGASEESHGNSIEAQSEPIGTS